MHGGDDSLRLRPRPEAFFLHQSKESRNQSTDTDVIEKGTPSDGERTVILRKTGGRFRHGTIQFEEYKDPYGLINGTSHQITFFQ